MASPFLSERVESAILRSLCIHHSSLLLNDMMNMTQFGVLVNHISYTQRGFIDDCFPSYPFRTTRKQWESFQTWVTYGVGSFLLPSCDEWIKFWIFCCRYCQTCKMMSQQYPRDYQPFVGERSHGSYCDDDEVMNIMNFEVITTPGEAWEATKAVWDWWRVPNPLFEKRPKQFGIGRQSFVRKTT